MDRQSGESLGATTQQEHSAATSQAIMDSDRDESENIGARAQDAAAQARDKASEVAEAGEERAADGMDRAAAVLREHSDSIPAGGVAVKAADGMERGADYLRSHETGEMWSDVENYVRDHPVMGIAGSVAAGFLVGRLLR